MHEIGEQPVFVRGEPDRRAVDEDAAGLGVEPHRAADQFGAGRGRSRAASARATGQHLLHDGRGLVDVIVGAGVEALHLSLQVSRAVRISTGIAWPKRLYGLAFRSGPCCPDNEKKQSVPHLPTAGDRLTGHSVGRYVSAARPAKDRSRGTRPGLAGLKPHASPAFCSAAWSRISGKGPPFSCDAIATRVGDRLKTTGAAE